jgi:hypothetical protein
MLIITQRFSLLSEMQMFLQVALPQRETDIKLAMKE